MIDNAAFYHGSEIKQLFQDFEIQLECLPPYSPDLNPIELTFNVIKSWLQRHADEARWHVKFGDSLIESLPKVVGADCECYSKAC